MDESEEGFQTDMIGQSRTKCKYGVEDRRWVFQIDMIGRPRI